MPHQCAVPQLYQYHRYKYNYIVHQDCLLAMVSGSYILT